MRVLLRARVRRTLTILTTLLVTRVPSIHAQAPSTRADSVALLITIYGVAFTNGTQTAHSAGLPEVVCVQGQRPRVDPPREVLDALQKDRTVLVRPMSACKTQGLLNAPRGTSLVVDTLTGKRGITVHAGEPTFDADGSFTVQTSYYQHGLSAADWVCKGRRRSDQSWEITSCTMTRIS